MAGVLYKEYRYLLDIEDSTGGTVLTGADKHRLMDSVPAKELHRKFGDILPLVSSEQKSNSKGVDGNESSPDGDNTNQSDHGGPRHLHWRESTPPSPSCWHGVRSRRSLATMTNKRPTSAHVQSERVAEDGDR